MHTALARLHRPHLVFAIVALTSACGSNHGASSTDASTDATSGDGDGGGGDAAVSALACPAGGFAGGLVVAPGENERLTTSCDVNGDLVIGATGSAAAALSVQGAVLTVHGNITLSGSGSLEVSGSGSELQLDNQANFQRTIESHDTSSISLDGCALATNLTGANNLTSNYNAFDSSVFTANNVTIDTERSWLLGNLNDAATLTSTNSAVPVEIYANDQSTVSSNGASDQHTLWLSLAAGTSGSITLPDPAPPVTWAAGRNNGQSVGWQVNVDGAAPQLAFSSHTGSSWQLHGSGSTSKEATIGFYVDPATTPAQPMAFSNLPLGTIGTSSAPVALTPPNTSSPQLSFYGVNIGPIGWQIYVGGGGAPSVSATIDSSVINEIGVVTGGHVVLSSSVSQLAVLAAEGTNASLRVTGSEIWSQDILAADGGTVQIDTSKIYGSLLEADPGSQVQIADALTTFYADGDATTCDPAAALAYIAAHAGVPMCNPFTNPGQLPQRLAAGGVLSISGAHPACFADNGAYVSGLMFDAGSSSMNPAGGNVQCSGAFAVSTPFSTYPVMVPGVPAGDAETCVVTTNGGSNSYAITAPTCE